MTNLDFGWSHYRVVDGDLRWDHIGRADCVIQQDGAYVAWECFSLPDGGQAWERRGHFSSATAAMAHLDALAEGFYK